MELTRPFLRIRLEAPLTLRTAVSGMSLGRVVDHPLLLLRAGYVVLDVLPTSDERFKLLTFTAQAEPLLA